jgi:hypothetical protein
MSTGEFNFASHQFNTTSAADYYGRVIARAVNRRVPTAAAARVRSQVKSCGGQSGTEVGFFPST